MAKIPDFEIHRIDSASPLSTGMEYDYLVTYRGRTVGQVAVHSTGYKDWSFSVGQPRPSLATQRRLMRSVRNDYQVR